MDKNVKISILCDLYGNLLTEKQIKFIDDYYNKDLSLSEIAENNGITRQAVRDSIKKVEKKLLDYEEKLLFMKKMSENEGKLKDIFIKLDEIKCADAKSEKNLLQAKNILKSLIMDGVEFNGF